MTPDEIRNLLAGYASGTLSERERAELFQAALSDQSLFDALADEEGLRELLADAEVRGELLAALDEPTGQPAPTRYKWYAFMGATASLGMVAAFVLTRPAPGPKLDPMAQLQAMKAVQPEARETLEFNTNTAPQTDEVLRAPVPRSAARPPAQPPTSPPEPAQTSTPVAAARRAANALDEATPGQVARALRSAASSYTVEQLDRNGVWQVVDVLRADAETRIVIRFPATGLVTATAEGREIARREVDTGDPVSFAVRSAEGSVTVTVRQPSSGFSLQIPLRFVKP